MSYRSLFVLRSIAVAVIVGVLSGGCGGSDSRPPANPVPTADTTLAAGDVFDVRIYGEEPLSGAHRVAQDGTIDFPLVGRVEVGGLEAPEIADLLEKRLREGKFLRNPQVSIFVKESNSKRISVMGAVASPGTFPMTPGLTVVQALSLAGGFTSIASRDGTLVTRRVDGNLKRFQVDVSDITAGDKEDFPLQAGDIVYVPERLF